MSGSTELAEVSVERFSLRLFKIFFNQPFDVPRSKARDLLRVDTERRLKYSTQPKGCGYRFTKNLF